MSCNRAGQPEVAEAARREVAALADTHRHLRGADHVIARVGVLVLERGDELVHGRAEAELERHQRGRE
jgi:hypothetical protein